MLTLTLFRAVLVWIPLTLLSVALLLAAVFVWRLLHPEEPPRRVCTARGGSSRAICGRWAEDGERCRYHASRGA